METISLKNDKEIRRDLIAHIGGKRLIPVIGSGFTRGERAHKGYVPSGSDMQEFMISKLEPLFGDGSKKLKTMKFSQIASLYEKHVELQDKQKYLHEFFTEIKLGEMKKEFLNLSWPYVYTLNIDDGIEANSKYDVILPNEELNNSYVSNKKVLYKLHGDARDVLKYKNSNKYIFSESQYISSLKTNATLLEILENDMFSNNIMYIGCSLADEIDILSKIINLQNRGTKIERNTYYITHREPDEIEKSQLEDYSIDYVVIIDDYESFYEEIINMHLEANKLKKESTEDYLNFRTSYITDENKNIEFIFDSNRTLQSIENKKIELPSFFFERDIHEQTLKSMKSCSLQVIYGHRFSGKTYLMYSLLKAIRDRDVYYFPSKIALNQETFVEILEKKKTVFLFDSNTLEEDQVKYVINNIDTFEKNSTQVILTINSSDKDIINIINSLKNERIKIKLLKNKLSQVELRKINEKLSIVGIPNFDGDKSFLDNIITIDSVLPSYNKIFEAPEFLNPKKEELVMMIILAVKESMLSRDLIKFDLVTEIGDFYNKLEPLIHYEYTSLLEKSDHSGSKVIPNAKYWILKSLGDFAKNSKNHQKIAEAYLYLAYNLQKNNKDQYKFSKEIAKYIKFDVINDVFPRSEQGSIALINTIYDYLRKVLSFEPQYFHQRAKSKLWYYKSDPSELQEALKSAKIAEHNLKLQKYNNDFKTTSLSHIRFTISLILGKLVVIDGFKNTDLLKEAISAYYVALLEKENEQYIYNSLQNANRYNSKRETVDLKKIIDHVSVHNKGLDEESKREFNVILNLFINNSKSVSMKFQNNRYKNR